MFDFNVLHKDLRTRLREVAVDIAVAVLPRRLQKQPDTVVLASAVAIANMRPDAPCYFITADKAFEKDSGYDADEHPVTIITVERATRKRVDITVAEILARVRIDVPPAQ